MAQLLIVRAAAVVGLATAVLIGTRYASIDWRMAYDPSHLITNGMRPHDLIRRSEASKAPLKMPFSHVVEMSMPDAEAQMDMQIPMTMICLASVLSE
ncbi:hypothetical protein HFN63_33110 [Rhizobium leguminosarum]|uniref:hypothetical protein n=1 Tax=Rhizobium leguminosarum TaxID=384 RepID=UPI001C9811D6|nr:hypothetical protein [Rhizobium leguminosarum]MBY5774868.1 hypothetical protein [Rhizobium leguminosarum]